jgi:hypothetical protein
MTFTSATVNIEFYIQHKYNQKLLIRNKSFTEDWFVLFLCVLCFCTSSLYYPYKVIQFNINITVYVNYTAFLTIL